MIIGCPTEIKPYENRVALIPSMASVLRKKGHSVLVERGAGLGSGIPDREYLSAGAVIVETAQEVWTQSDLILKVKEPVQPEYAFFRPGQIIFTFFHLAAEPELTKALLAQKVAAVAYETIGDGHNLPLLKPMSEVAGRMAVQVGAWCLESKNGGKGILLGGVPGVRKARVAILGAGVVGTNAAKIALGMQAQVSMLDISGERLAAIDDLFGGQVHTQFSHEHAIRDAVKSADLLIGAVLQVGARAPCLVTREMIQSMEKGSAVIDVAVDQGGCIETVRKTTHDAPTYQVDGVVHYGVANMPGAVAQTSTFALAHATSPYLLALCEQGLKASCLKDHRILNGLNTFLGHVTFRQVAQAHDLPFVEAHKIFTEASF